MVKQDTRKSIKAFLSELKNRIELLSGKEVTENIDNSKINEINKVLAKYNISTDTNINSHDLMNFEKSDIASLLSYVGQNRDSIEYMMGKVDEYYENIAGIINQYICDFISIGTNQTQMFNEKIRLYKKYIQLFEQTSFSEPFDEINEISKVMSEIGLLDEDKWKILEYIALENNRIVEDQDINLELAVSREYEKLEAYLSDENIRKIVQEKFETAEIDIDTIPTLAAELSKQTGIEKNIMTNIVSVVIASNLLDRYAKSGNKDDKEEIRNITISVLSNLTSIHDIAYYEALSIKNSCLDFYYNSLENGISEDMFKDFIDKPLSEIESDVVSREYAIDLKELAVLKPIFDTLETIDSLDIDSESYQKAIIILKKLTEQYKLLEEKKVNYKEKKN